VRSGVIRRTCPANRNLLSPTMSCSHLCPVRFNTSVFVTLSFQVTPMIFRKFSWQNSSSFFCILLMLFRVSLAYMAVDTTTAGLCIVVQTSRALYFVPSVQHFELARSTTQLRDIAGCVIELLNYNDYISNRKSILTFCKSVHDRKQQTFGMTVYVLFKFDLFFLGLRLTIRQSFIIIHSPQFF